MGRFDGKTAIITGGSAGIGLAVAARLAGEGAEVLITGRRPEQLKAAVADLTAQGASVHALAGDVSAPDAPEQIVAAALSRWSRIDVLVNNAGVLLMRGILETSRADFERVLGINLVGAFLGIKAVAPKIIERGGGSIINVSSIDGLKGSNAVSAYSASKWGMRGLTKVAAMELGPRGVRVNSVHPGGIATPMTTRAGQTPEVEAATRRFYKGVPIGRVGAPEEVARVSVFLASEDASYMCGAEIAVDGGMSIGPYYMSQPGAPVIS